MDLKGALRARLAVGAAAASVGARIYWTQRIQGEPLPAIVMQVISDPRPQHLKGFDQLRETRVQIDCLGPSDKIATDLAEAVIADLVPAAITAGIRFNRAYVDAVRDLGEQTDTAFIHRASVDLRVWWQPE